MELLGACFVHRSRLLGNVLLSAVLGSATVACGSGGHTPSVVLDRALQVRKLTR